ncbi:hypothetical protein MRX96_016092 [Rhipicephalus microplus]
MPLTCCVPGCRSGYRNTTDKASLFCLPSDHEQRDRWKRAISRQGTDAFSFESKARTCDLYAAGEDGGAISTGGCTKAACQTERNVCSISKLQAVKDQLRSTKPQLRLCQVKIAKLTAQANKSRKSHEDVQKRSAREKLIFDHWLMKANAKSATAAWYKKENLEADFGFDSTLFTVLREKLEAVPERKCQGVLMFDEMSVRKSVHIRELDMTLLGKADFAEHTRPGDYDKDGDHVLVFLF